MEGESCRVGVVGVLYILLWASAPNIGNGDTARSLFYHSLKKTKESDRQRSVVRARKRYSRTNFTFQLPRFTEHEARSNFW